MDAPHIATAHYAIIPPSLSISISPPSASICVGQSTAFTSTVSGGITPYSYQWYLNGSSVSGATSSSWAFSPTAPGTYSVYLKVTDKNGNTAQSAPATVNVSPAGGVPVGGYSISLVKQTPVSSMTMYAMLIALFGAALSLTKRKRK
jgi:PKD repeat protein